MDILPSMYQIAYDLGYKAGLETPIEDYNPFDEYTEHEMYEAWNEGFDDSAGWTEDI